MEDPDYLVGYEPEGSDLNYSGWQKKDFGKFHDWVLAQNFLPSKILTVK